MFIGHRKQANAGTRTPTSLLICAEKSGLTKRPTLLGTAVLGDRGSQLSQMDRTGPGSEGGMEILLRTDFSWGTRPLDSLESPLGRGRPSVRTRAKLVSCLGVGASLVAESPPDIEQTGKSKVLWTRREILTGSGTTKDNLTSRCLAVLVAQPAG